MILIEINIIPAILIQLKQFRQKSDIIISSLIEFIENNKIYESLNFIFHLKLFYDFTNQNHFLFFFIEFILFNFFNLKYSMDFIDWKNNYLKISISIFKT